MRDLQGVITKMLDVIPKEESELREALKNNLSSVRVAPPEMIPTWWNEVFDTLSEFLFTPEKFKPEGWMEEVRQLWTAEK